MSVRSEGGTMVDAIDMVRDCGGMLPWLVFLVFVGKPPLMEDCEEAGVLSSAGDISAPPDSRLRFGMTRPLIIVCV